MIELLLKASFAMGIAFLFYKLLLQQESFFTANRLYLLCCLALAFALPFINLPPLVSQQGYLASVFENDVIAEASITEVRNVTGTQTEAGAPVVSMPPQVNTDAAGAQEAAATNEAVAANSGGISWVFWVVVLYLFGVAVFTLSLLFQVGSIVYKIITATDKIQDGDCVIVNTAGRQAPCSFFKYIFIHPDEYDYDTYEQIIAHEKVHARLGHSFDLLLAEIAVIILWFNPLAWLWKREIEKNNEYQTDAQLLEKEQVRKEQYQLNLLQIAVPNKPLSITTNYNQSLLKQRIMMMNAKRSTIHAYWKYAFLAPLFFGTLLVMNEPAVSSNIPAGDMGDIMPRAVQERIMGAINEEVKEKVQESRLSKTAAVTEESPVEESPVVVEKEKIKERAPVGPQRGPIGAVREPMPSPRVISAAPGKRGMSINITGRQTDMSEGFWYSSRENGEYCISFKGEKNTSSWNMSRCFDSAQFQKKGDNTYVLTKEAGTLQLTGNLDAEVGQGKYTFTENAGFKNYLTSNNISSRDQNLLFHLFFGDVNKDYVEFLKQQYGNVDGNRLLELAIHGVKQPDFKNYIALFQKYSNKKPSIQEVVEARIHGISEAYVQELQAMNFTGVSLKKMMEAKIHGVNGAFVESLKKAGFNNLPLDKLIEAKIHGVNPSLVNELQGLGYGKLSLDEVIQLKIHNVDAAYVKDLRSAGLDKLTLNQVVEAKIHGLNAASIKEIRALGFENIGFRDIVSAKIHGVNAAFVEELQKAGFKDISIDDAVAARIHRVDGAFIKKAREEGYNLNSIDKYVSLKIHGMAMESLKNK
ncbi:M56 family metallopeptidase [Pontibacter akesuensis]|uniref:BlaR1 peptidase M56 n=1 Tax=Pontibacter akesuensis TaxID=388950 RepID=A0A1I7GLX4_9BACT|nr:M56 family metallopeptidase [Pontibacter akesuensis]GHA56096.1 hypothetical protein GCM10007389_04560 [Pontibacter akesuensis]SFU49438.1 BlaR1 peptidase M56 [Pontibacter akesuensis]